VLVGNPLPLGPRSGLKWQKLATDEPPAGCRVLESAQLAAALTHRTEFTEQEWDAFGIRNLREDHVVMSGGSYFEPERFYPLPYAEQEARGIHEILTGSDVEVDEIHLFCAHSNPRATKVNIKRFLEGAVWAHLACHGDLDSHSLVLAVPERSHPDHAHPNLSMLEVQGSAAATDKQHQEVGVRLGDGATVVLSSCNSGRGDVRAEGVVGLARGFLAAGASAVVVSLWSVDDGSTAALMKHMYQYLVSGSTVPQALRLAMLRLARQDVGDGVHEWKRPVYWAGFLVMGASTCLP